MKRLVLCGVLALHVAACSCTDGDRASRMDSGRAELSGTVLDRATGERIAGAEVTLPDGRHATCDSNGRFLLRDLTTGMRGAVTARAPDGREGRSILRPLAARPLEIVIYAGP